MSIARMCPLDSRRRTIDERYGRGFGRGSWDDHDRERDERQDPRRSGPRDEQRERYYAGDWDQERFHRAPENRRDESYGWARERDYPNDRDYGRSDLRDRQFQSAYGAGSGNQYWHPGGREYGPRGYAHQSWRPEDRWENRSSQTTLRGIGQSGDENRSRGGFFGKGPRGYVRSDERIREDVCELLSFNDELDATDISVTVAKGEVTLEGTVPDRHSKRLADDIADSVNGVTDVHNRLRANKPLMQEVGDKIMGRDTESTGHAGSGTRNSPGIPAQNNH
jgi:osmotically-inducible protein OsmY